MKKVISLCFLASLFFSCNKNINSEFIFPSNDLAPISPSSLREINTVLVGYSTSAGQGTNATNVVFDGVNLVVPALTQTNRINFNILNTNLDVVTSYDATATNVYRIYTATSNGAGNIYIIWRDSGGTKYFSTWPTTNPAAAVSSFTFNPLTYGCSARDDFRIVHYQNVFYGVCTSNTSIYKMRLFSFSLIGSLLSSIEINSLDGMGAEVVSMSMAGSTIYVTTGGSYSQKSFVKFNTSFQNLGTLSNVTSGLSSYGVNSFASSGSNLFIANGYKYCNTFAQGCYQFTKTTMDGL